MPFLTIVFTDVVQSSATKRDVSLGRDNRERDRAYLEKIQTRHFSLVRECCSAHQGHEVSTMGDAFCLTFDDPIEAVRFSAELQKRLTADPVDTPRGPLRLRIGIHSGFPESFEGGWHGTDVDTAARVESTASEHQILLSSRTYELVRHMTDVKFHPRGEFALKGLEQLALWEADWDGKGPRPTAVPPLPSTRSGKRTWLVLGAAAAILIAAGAAYFYRAALKLPMAPGIATSQPANVASAPAKKPESVAAPPTTQTPPASGHGETATQPRTQAPSKAPAKAPAQTTQAPEQTPTAGPAPIIRYISGSSIKLEQLVGDEDKERHQPTRSRTFTRFGLQGTDLGSSFEHDGHAYFLFGDTIGRLGRALDSIAMTDARDPESGVTLDFLTSDGKTYMPIEPPGISMGFMEVPVAGISLGGQMYVVVSTNHKENASTDRSVLTKFTPPAAFQPLRTISQLPAGHFIKMSLHVEPGSNPALPPGGPFVFIWGTGDHSQADAYLSLVPMAQFASGNGTRYFAAFGAAGAPSWSDKESEAKPVVEGGILDNVSVTWCKDCGGLWLMTYDSRPPLPGIAFRYSRRPWGPWSKPQILFNFVRDGALGKFIHNPKATTDDGLAGPVKGQLRGKDAAAVMGAAYAPYVVERWTKVRNSELNLYYLLSTRNPYVVVLMKSRLQID